MTTEVEVIPESTKVIRFMERLKNPEGTEWAGKPLKLKRWEKRFVRKLLDTKDGDGFHQYEQALVFLPKKQGKSTFFAALGLALGAIRAHQQIAVVALSIEQASLIYKFAKSMVEQEQSLDDRCTIFHGNNRKIDMHFSDSTLTVYSSDAVTANGINCSILLYDEVCFEDNSDLWDAIVSGGINRSHILAIGLSTAGFSTSGFGYGLYVKAKAVADMPELDPSFLAVIYEAPDGVDWTDINAYIACSPTFAEDLEDPTQAPHAIRRIKKMIESAKKHPSEIKKLLRYHLNKWIGDDSKEPWIGIEIWDTCPNDFNPEMLAGRECTAGLDIAAVKDMTALCLTFDIDNDMVAALWKFYMGAELLAQRERTDPGAMYTTWARMGILTATPGDWCDYSYIRNDLKKLREIYQIKGIAVDRAFNAAHLCQELITDGHNVIPIGQGIMTVAPAAREVETLVVQKKFMHFKNPIARWNVTHCVAKVIDDAGNVKPSKKLSTGRIDGVYALIDSIALKMLYRTGAGQQGTPDVYTG